jgi:hypothetical protein
MTIMKYVYHIVFVVAFLVTIDPSQIICIPGIPEPERGLNGTNVNTLTTLISLYSHDVGC